MDKIKVLDKKVQELIAAGEVVERPASVVKELVENSIDAGATSITVEIKNGGLSYIRISDNGCGMSPVDARTAFLRHATSKIRTQADLASIYTMGFRGEALCAIASVSKIRLLTKEKEADFGYSLYIEGADIIEEGECGCPDGTTITVNDLFYNTPARLQFMKTAASEANHVSAIVEKLALSRPDISFRLIKDGKEVIFTAGDGQLLSAIFSVYDKETAFNTLPVDYSQGDISVSGFVCKPLYARGNRNMQVFFVNGRYIKNTTIAAALERAYKNSMMTGRFPYCVLSLEIKASTVDVNVHPTKQEIKFSDENSIFGCIYYGVKSALEVESSAVSRLNTKDTDEKAEFGEIPSDVAVESSHKTPEADLSKENLKKEYSYEIKANNTGLHLPLNDVSAPKNGFDYISTYYKAPNIEFDASMREAAGQEAPRQIAEEKTDIKAFISTELKDDKPSFISESEKTAKQMPKGDDTLISHEATFIEGSPIAILGQLFNTYILAQFGDEFLMIDKHAAHERIIFDKLKEETGDFDTQMLLTPLEINVSREDFDVLAGNAKEINKYGFSIEEFGEGSLITREIPTIISGYDVQEVLEEIAEAIRAGGTLRDLEVRDNILHTMACKAAVKAGSDMSKGEMKQFTEKLLSMPEVKYCPHGRPVMVRLNKTEIEKLFRRKR